MPPKFAHPTRMIAGLLVGIAITISSSAPLPLVAKEVPAAKPPQKVLGVVPADSVDPMAASAMKKLSMPPNRIVVELDHSGTADGAREVSSEQPLCLGEVVGCRAVIEQASDRSWKVAITGRQAGVKQMIEIDGLTPKTTVILIGVNNILQCPDEKPEWIAAGIEKIVATARKKMPASKIILMGILPARNPGNHPARARIAAVNRLFAKLDDGIQVPEIRNEKEIY